MINMELWVRSQGNYEVDITPRLIKVNDICLDYCGENDSYYILVNNGIEVAYYNSEKRALEVLDEIQDLLKPKIMIKYNDDFTMSVSSIEQQPTTYVYEMSEE